MGCTAPGSMLTQAIFRQLFEFGSPLCQSQSKNGPYRGVKLVHYATGVLFAETTAAFSGGAGRRAGLPACRAGSPEKAFMNDCP